jgi:hypothetical protein
MTTIRTVQEAIATAYTGITLPGGLGVPAAQSVDLDGNPTSLPCVVVYRNPTRTVDYGASGSSYTIIREYVARVYTERITDSSTPSASSPEMNRAADIIDTVHAYFAANEYAVRADGINIQYQAIEADTGDTVLTTPNQDKYAGVAFRHVIKTRHEK